MRQPRDILYRSHTLFHKSPKATKRTTRVLSAEEPLDAGHRVIIHQAETALVKLSANRESISITARCKTENLSTNRFREFRRMGDDPYLHAGGFQSLHSRWSRTSFVAG